MLPEPIQKIINDANALVSETNPDLQYLETTIKNIKTILSDHVHPMRQKVNTRIAKKASVVVDEQGNELTESIIEARIQMLAKMLTEDPSIQNPMLISLMDGALPFASSLQKELIRLGYSFEYTTLRATSMKGLESGDIQIDSLPEKINLACRDVLVIDDVLDKGKTWYHVKKSLEKHEPHCIRLMVLVDKAQERFHAEAHANYVGFTVNQDKFIIGMGLDYNGAFRNTLSISAVDLTSLPSADESELLQLESPCNQLLKKLNEKKLVVILEQKIKSKPRTSSLIIPNSLFRSPASNDLYPGINGKQTPPVTPQASSSSLD